MKINIFPSSIFRWIGISALVLITVQCSNPKIEDPRIELKWASKPLFSTPESVVFDPIRNEYYVSNLNGEPDERNGNGIISRVSVEGEMLQPNWIHRMDAPKGMVLDGYRLYVTDIDRVLEIDTKSGSIFTQFNVKNARFLSDVELAPNGVLYVSDTYWNRIYRIEEGSVDLFLESDELDNPEGLSIRDGILYIGTKNSVMQLNLKTKELTTFAANTGPVHGIDIQVDGTCLISNWHGQLVLVHSDGYQKLLLDGMKRNINMSDFLYTPGPNLIIIPTFYDDRLLAFHWNPSGAE